MVCHHPGDFPEPLPLGVEEPSCGVGLPNSFDSVFLSLGVNGASDGGKVLTSSIERLPDNFKDDHPLSV